MNREDTIKFLILRSIGNFLLLLAIYGVFATFGPALYYELQYRVVLARGIKFEVSDSKAQAAVPAAPQTSPSLGFGEILVGPTEQVLTPIDTDFSIMIPKLGANAKVFPNIDSSNENEFLPVLQHGVAHAKGTVFPGLPGNVYLFAHSTDNFWNAGRYNAIFYLLKDLAAGDDVVVFFENKRYNYKVSEVKVVDPEEVSLLVKSQEEGESALILQTCWPPGTAWKRQIVIATPI